ncbi:MAG: helix-turn-helix transcriptional regulator [Deltaproteobacteria bacterium]|jgi:DNA-binding XRE family transcriptional regulator|nr:helix-turn-helix transcriptional regulator [Deltaproteobacteria bacterium]
MKNKKTILLPPGIRNSLSELGDLISCARKEKQWTQEELSKRIGINRMTLGRMEKGAPEVSIGCYLTAAWLLGLPILTWQTMDKGDNDTFISNLLIKLKKNLPDRVRAPGKTIDNDF